MKKLVVATVLAAMFGNCAYASEWRPIGYSSKAAWFIDTSSLKAVSASKVAWVKIEVKSSEVKDGGDKYSIFKYAAHCKTRQIQILSMTAYSNTGSVNFSGSRAGQSDEVYPESIGEALFNAMCNNSSPVRTKPIVKDTALYTEAYFSWKEDEQSAK